MTLYIRSPFANVRRRMLENMMDRDWNDFGFENNLPMPIDVKAEDESYVLTAWLPGVVADDLNIQVVNESITISGELKAAREDNSSYLLAEIPSGRFSRTITLPMPLNASAAEANLSNGVLTLRVPKAEEAKPKSIKIVTKNKEW
jgi:HSP20 family protein